MIGSVRRRVSNGIDVLFGAPPPSVGVSRRSLVWQREKVRLWRYAADGPTLATPVLLIHSMVSRSYILDLTAANSFIGRLRRGGLDVYLLDWGIPDDEESDHTLVDYVDDYVPEAFNEVVATSGSRDASLLGYCFGGVLALVFAARHDELPIRNLVTMATAVDFDRIGVVGRLLQRGRIDPRSLLDGSGNLSAGLIRHGIRLLRPTADLAAGVHLWQHLDDDEYVRDLRAVEHWLNDQIPFPGALFRECVELLVRQNALMNDRVRVAGERVDLRRITCPFLAIVGENDYVVPAASAEPILSLIDSDDASLLRLPTGHIAFVTGRRASAKHAPMIVDWLATRSA